MTALTIDEPVVPRAIIGRSPSELAWRRLRHDKVAMMSAAVVGLVILIAILAPAIEWLYGISPDQAFTAKLTGDAVPKGYLGGVDGDHWLGIEPLLGRDVFMQIIFGIRTSLTLAFLAGVLSTALGVVLGLIAGYVGGRTDAVIGWILDLGLAMPALVFFLAVVPATQAAVYTAREAPSATFKVILLVGVFTVFGWMGPARIVRGQVLSLREREFVEAARAAGASTSHMVFKQLLPNLWGPILVTFSLAVPGFITAEGALAFLSIGITEPTPDLGRMIATSAKWIQIDPAYFIFPSATLFLIVLTFNLFGDALRDALDPRSHR